MFKLTTKRGDNRPQCSEYWADSCLLVKSWLDKNFAKLNSSKSAVCWSIYINVILTASLSLLSGVSPNIYCLFPYQSLVGLVLVMPSHTSVIEGLAEINSLVASPEQTGWSPAYLSTLSTKEENIRFILFTPLESPAK